MNSIPAEAVSIYNQALDLSNRADLQGAITQYRKAIDIYPDFIEAYNNIGEIYSRMGKHQLAIDIYKEALKRNNNYSVLLNIGVEFYNREDFKTALDYFKKSLKQKDDFLEGFLYAALAHYSLDDYKKAETNFLKVLEIDRKHVKANYILSYIYYEWKEYQKALECLERIRDISEDRVFIDKYYGFCCYYLGRYDEAVQYLKSALELQPKYAQFRSYLDSLTYENKVKEIGDVDKAIKELEEKMKEDDESSFREVTRLSMLYIFKGKNKEAEKILLSAKKRLAS